MPPPSIFLSGYIFPLDNMPSIFYGLSFFVPATYMMQISLRALPLIG